MDFVFIILFIFIVGGYILGKIFHFFLPKSKDSFQSDKPTTFITHNHIKETHNHLHVDEKTLEKLTQNKK